MRLYLRKNLYPINKPFDSEKILMAINRLIEERKNPLEI